MRLKRKVLLLQSLFLILAISIISLLSIYYFHSKNRQPILGRVTKKAQQNAELLEVGIPGLP